MSNTASISNAFQVGQACTLLVWQSIRMACGKVTELFTEQQNLLLVQI